MVSRHGEDGFVVRSELEGRFFGRESDSAGGRKFVAVTDAVS